METVSKMLPFCFRMCATTDCARPAGMALRGDVLFVGTAQQIRSYIDLDGDGRSDSSWVFFDKIPFSDHPYEWTSALTFDGDGSLYFVLTTDSWNAGASPDPEGLRGSIVHVSADGSRAERFATGVRSVPAMVRTTDGTLLFVDNEGGGNPTEELNHAVEGSFYGHNPSKFGSPAVTGPMLDLRTEVAPSGLTIGSDGDLFVSFYGPGERWRRGGIGRIHFSEKRDSSPVGFGSSFRRTPPSFRL
ncbi:MAG: PQQ-dependent sugar dehydrogenase [Rhodothermales bacterium]